MSRYDLRTAKGHDFFEVSSALQKSIRRGLEDEAMYWAVELFNSNYAEYVWKRLRIIASEDVGLASPGIASEIMALYQSHKLQAAKKDTDNAPERLFLTHAVILLCRVPKSRVIDWALLYHWNRHGQTSRPIPDFALDKHNDRGRALGRGFKHFLEEGTRLVNMANPVEDEQYKARAETVLNLNPNETTLSMFPAPAVPVAKGKAPKASAPNLFSDKAPVKQDG